jgi:sugar lactone lactonase YvrE
MSTTLLFALAACPVQDPPPVPTPPPVQAFVEAIDVREVGFKTPECAVWDAAADVYLVSNIHGHPLDQDDNGFISRVTPEGKVEALKWIDGAADGVTLNAPKGMALVGDVLWVTDIDTVRRFDRKTGKPLEAIPVKGVSFLNDICADGKGSVYVTDTGLQRDEKTILAPNGKPRFVHIDVETADASVQTMAELAKVFAVDGAIGLPNGVVCHDAGVALVTWDTGMVHVFTTGKDGKRSARAIQLPKAQLDGLVAHAGGWLVSSWEGSCVYSVRAEGDQQMVATLVSDIKAAADLGFDAKRKRVLIPLFLDDALLIRSLAKR